MHSGLLCLLCSWIMFSKLATTQSTVNVSRPGCPSRCGSVTVPYPFGIVGTGTNCSMSSSFNIHCNTSVDPPTMFLSTRDGYPVINISDSDIRIHILQPVSQCYRNGSIDTTLSSNLTLDFTNTPFTLSESNRLTMIGCSDMAIVRGNSLNLTESNFGTGCVSFCSEGDTSRNDSCPGSGCCEIPIRNGTEILNASISSLENNVMINKPCSYSFLGEQDSFVIQAVSDFYRPSFSIVDWLETVPVILDWRIGTETCQEASQNSTSFACQQNTECIDAEAGAGGYRCRCQRGYEGNPYLSPGCQDIDECANGICPSANCTNYQGGWSCQCAAGYYNSLNSGYLDPETGSVFRCLIIPTPPRLNALSIGLICGSIFLALLSISFLLTRFVKKRKNEHRKQQFFKQNGGFLLRQETNNGILGKTRIFTAKELEKATDRFNESRILGRGGQGTVYKGMLSDGQIVAIKKSQLVDENKSKHLVEQFINEVVLLSQINHKNIVKLLGCCLETQVPLLVYEFMSNGTLFELIHDKNIEFPISWNMMLKVATDVAGALAYLHSSTSSPIFHRDIKSSNILLDEKFVAKVSDFGTSKSVNVDQTHLTTLVQGTFGYIDPEYFQSSQFTEKSDVYSFGVVLVELLTGLKAIIASTNIKDEKSLVSRFLSQMEDNNLELILDKQLAAHGESKGIVSVANLAKRCLHLNGKQRPTMKEVAIELENVSSSSSTLMEDSSFFKRPTLLSTVSYDYSWTNTSDSATTPSSHLCPITQETI